MVVYVSIFEEIKITYKNFSENLNADCSSRLKEKF
jgi:hypothetical protein